MDERFPEFQKELDNIRVPTEKLDLLIQKTFEQNFANRTNNKKRIYFISVAILVLSILIGFTLDSPTMAMIRAKLLFKDEDHNIVQLEQHPGQTKAYMELVSSWNKGDLNSYLKTYSRSIPKAAFEQKKKEFKTAQSEMHQIGATITLIYSDKKKSILLSNEDHIFQTLKVYNLDQYVILTKENEKWKVLDILPFKKTSVGTDRSDNDFILPFKKTSVGTNRSDNDFDHTNEVRKKINEKYQINIRNK